MGKNIHPIARRFRGLLPVVVDVETAGFNPQTDALLEIAIVLLRINSQHRWEPSESMNVHVLPFPGANLEPSALEFTGIDPYHPFRFALHEHEALETIFLPIRQELHNTGCRRAVLVGHNPSFDLSFLKATIDRNQIKKIPFHSFVTFDTATLAGLAFGQTVLAKAVQSAGLSWDSHEAHSALYDAKCTAELFCTIVNLWEERRL